jgi:hypothetical protein
MEEEITLLWSHHHLHFHHHHSFLLSPYPYLVTKKRNRGGLIDSTIQVYKYKSSTKQRFLDELNTQIPSNFKGESKSTNVKYNKE